MVGAVEICPILPTDLTFQHYWTISFTLFHIFLQFLPLLFSHIQQYDSPHFIKRHTTFYFAHDHVIWSHIFLIYLRPLYYVLYFISYFPIPYFLYHQNHSSIFQMLRYIKRDVILANDEIKHIYARVRDSAEFQTKASGSKDSKVCPSFKDLCPDQKMQRFTQALTQDRPRN